MTETRAMRREWIKQDKPNIKEVLEVFPLLKDPPNSKNQIQ